MYGLLPRTNHFSEEKFDRYDLDRYIFSVAEFGILANSSDGHSLGQCCIIEE